MKSDHVRQATILVCQVRKGLVKGHEIVYAEIHLAFDRVNLKISLFVSVSAPLQPCLTPSTFNQYPSHGLSRGPEKVSPAVPVVTVSLNQPNVGFMDESSRLEGLPGGLLGESLSCQQTQLFVDQGKQVIRGLLISLFNGI